MAAITFNTACRKMQLVELLGTALSACREMLDAFVSNRMRHAGAEAETVRQQTARTAPSGLSPEPAENTSVRFDLPGPDVLSETIPVFFIGRNKAGLWVAREARGRTGGIFLLRSSAVAFARAWSGAAGCATIFPDERFELDLVNEGNPFATPFGELMRFVASPWLQRGKTTLSV